MKESESLRQSFLKKWDALLKESTLLALKKDQVLFYQGHLPYGVFVVASGEVDLVYENNPGEKETVSAPLNTPIGVDFLYDNVPYPFTAVARGSVVTMFIDKNQLKRVLEKKPS